MKKGAERDNRKNIKDLAQEAEEAAGKKQPRGTLPKKRCVCVVTGISCSGGFDWLSTREVIYNTRFLCLSFQACQVSALINEVTIRLYDYVAICR